jgi:ribosomal protein S6--L-glutamate ligase
MYPSIQLYVLLERRYRSQAQPSGLIRSFKEQGFQVTVIDSSKARKNLYQDTQHRTLAVIRGRSRELLALVSQLETRGVQTINRSDAIRSVLNKASMGVALQKAGVPTAATYYEPAQVLARRLSRGAYPLILKPVFGDNARGLRIVSSAEDLAALDWPEPLALAQTYLVNDGYDLKLYCIGDDVWAVRKPSPLSIHQILDKQAQPVPITPQLKQLAQRCGALFGLEFYGVDCILTPSGPVVIEVNDFPNYTGISEANERLAYYIIHKARN